MRKILTFGIFLIFVMGCANTSKDGYKFGLQSGVFEIDYDNFYYTEDVEKITIPFLEYPVNLNPYRAISDSEKFLASALFSSLFYIDPKSRQPRKNLVDTFVITPNGLKYSFKIHNNIKFIDGKILSTDDIIASLSLLNTVLKNTHIYKTFFINNTTLSFEKIDNLNFNITLDTPNSNLIYALSDYPILKEEAIQGVTNDIKKFVELYIAKISYPVGTGPFMIKNFKENYIELIKNPNYFKSSKKVPYASEITLNFYKDNNSIVADFINGNVDVKLINDTEKGDLYQFYHNFDNSVKFIQTDYSMTQIFLSYNANPQVNKILKEQDYRKYLNNIIVSKYQGEFTTFSSFDNTKGLPLKYEGILANKNYFTATKLNFISPEEDVELVNLSKAITTILQSEKIDVNLQIIPYYQYLDRMFYTGEFDLALTKYSFDNKITALNNLFNDDILSFSNFIDNNSNYKELVLKLFNENSFTKQNSIIEEFKKTMYDEALFTPFFSKKMEYITNDIYNLKNYNERYNLNTIEHIVKKRGEK